MYGLITVLLLHYPGYSGRGLQWIGWVLLAVPAAPGSLIFSPVAPHQFRTLLLQDVQDEETIRV